MLVALIGESSVGKTTIMRVLQRTRNYFYVRNVTTRHARFGEYYKTTISTREFDAMNARNELAFVNVFFGHHYGYLKADVEHAIGSVDVTAMIDFGIENIRQLDGWTGVAKVIILPESEEMLRKSLRRSRRDRDVEAVVKSYREKYGALKEGVEAETGRFIVRNYENDVGATAYRIAEHLSALPQAREVSQIGRSERLSYILENLRLYPEACSGLEAYKYLTEAIDKFEDRFGVEPWSPPRTFLDGTRTSRMYTIFPESFLRVSRFPGVTLLLSKRELVFISRNGAIQIQDKDLEDLHGERVPFCDRKDRVIFDKVDSSGNDVWFVGPL